MRAVTVAEPGGPEVLGWGEVPDPVCGPGEVIVDVAATAVNRADLHAAAGLLPAAEGRQRDPRPGVQRGDQRGRRGRDRLVGRRRGVRAALRRRLRRTGRRPGGTAAARARRRRAGHRGRAARGHLHRLVQRVPARRAAPRATASSCTADPAASAPWPSSWRPAPAPACSPPRARRRSSTSAASSAPRCGINYRDEDFVERVKEETDGAGVDVILDNMGAKYLARNVDALAVGGRLVIDRHAGRHEGRARPRRS